MGSTNKTTNLELSQFIGTDKPSWLNDYNADMLAIDAAVGTNVTNISTAQSRADSAYTLAENTASNLNALSSQVTANTTDIATLEGNVNSINSLIGNGTPTTTDQTIIGAINEINANVADDLVTVSSDGVKTTAQVLENIRSYIVANIDAMRSAPYKYMIVRIDSDAAIRIFRPVLSTSSSMRFDHNSIYADSHLRMNGLLLGVAAQTISVDISSSGATFTDSSSTVLSSGITFKLIKSV